MDLSYIQSVDLQNMWGLLEGIPDQWKEAMQLTENLETTIDPSRITSICFVGMGSSTLGADIIRSYVYETCSHPIQAVRHYEVPGWVDKHTLVIACSYSGNTEETLVALSAARECGAQAIAVTSGGQLLLKAANEGFDYIRVPDGLPARTALGYMFIPLFRLFSQLGFIEEGESVLEETYQLLIDQNMLYSNPSDNEALILAKDLDDSLPIIYSDAVTMGPVNRRWRCQFAENTKTLAYGGNLPEISHNEIVGWERITHLTGRLSVIMLQDADDNKRVSRRMQIVEELIRDQTATLHKLRAKGESKLTRIFSLIQMADWTSFYLALLNGIDPTPTTKIDLLKNKLAET